MSLKNHTHCFCVGFYSHECFADLPLPIELDASEGRSMTKRSLALLATVPLCTSFAFAADLPARRAPTVYVPPPILTTWTGFYAGVNAGAAVGGSSASTLGTPIFNVGGASAGPETQADNDVLSTNSFGTSKASALLGGQIGYNYQFAGPYVAGIEVDAQGLPGSSNTRSLTGALAIAGFPDTLISTTTLSKRTDYIGTVRGRLGYVVTPSLLVYVTGGFAYGGVNSSTNTTNNIVGGPTGLNLPFTANASRSTILTGYTVGGGLEYKFTPDWSVKIEGLYYDLGTLNYGSTLASTIAAGGAPFTIDSIRTRVRYNGEIARVGLNYHFNTLPAPVVARY